MSTTLDSFMRRQFRRRQVARWTPGLGFIFPLIWLPWVRRLLVDKE